jgi:hypothetical protein
MTFSSPSNLRFDPQANWWQEDDMVKLLFTPPTGWSPSRIDKWIDWDLGIWDGNSIGSCMDCPWEAAARWDAAQISMYDSVYLTKIRYLLIEPEIQYKLLVYQGTPEAFDTLLKHPLLDNLTYNAFDTLDLDPIQINPSKDLWIGYWVNSMASGYPLPVGPAPVVEGYGNMVSYIPGTWRTLTYINPALAYNWSIGGYLETPNDTIIYPLFNVYRSINDLPYEKIHEGNFYDTIYFDYIRELAPSSLHYYVTCVYEDGESVPSDTLYISLVGIPEIMKGKINVYPNPAKDRVSIDSGNGNIKSVSLINTKGEMVFEKLFTSEKVQLDLSAIPSSFYILKVLTTDGVFTSKLLIVK